MSEELTTVEAGVDPHSGEAEAPEEMVTPAVPDPASGESPEPAEPANETPAEAEPETVNPDDLVIVMEPVDSDRVRLKAIIEAVIYITDEPLASQQIAGALSKPIDQIKSILDELTAEYGREDRGLSIREVAGGYKMATKPEHHEEIRAFVKNLKPPLKLSLAALETLAVIAYKQPITAPEIMEIRGVQGAGVLKTLLDRKLIGTAGRKNVIGKPILYKTTKEFLVQFGLKDLAELPTLREFEDLGRLALTDAEAEPGAPSAAPEQMSMPEQVDDSLPQASPIEEPGPDPTPVTEPPAEPEQPVDPEEKATESKG